MKKEIFLLLYNLIFLVYLHISFIFTSLPSSMSPNCYSSHCQFHSHLSISSTSTTCFGTCWLNSDCPFPTIYKVNQSGYSVSVASFGPWMWEPCSSGPTPKTRTLSPPCVWWIIQLDPQHQVCAENNSIFWPLCYILRYFLLLISLFPSLIYFSRPYCPFHLFICINYSFHSAVSFHLSLFQLFSLWKLVEYAPILFVLPSRLWTTASFLLLLRNIPGWIGTKLFLQFVSGPGYMPSCPEWTELRRRTGTIKMRIQEWEREAEGRRKVEEIGEVGGLLNTIYLRLCLKKKKRHIISPQACLSPFSHTIGSNEVWLVCTWCLCYRDISTDEGINCLCMHYCAPAGKVPCLFSL